MKFAGSQGGNAHDSYSKNSHSQNYVFHQYAKPHFSQALDLVLSTFLPCSNRSSAAYTASNSASRPHPIALRVADLGCSHGPNTIDHARFITQAILQEAALLYNSEEDANHQNSDVSSHVELQYFFSDLPGNDFNALFRSLQPIGPQLQGLIEVPAQEIMTAFAAGVPGSFYGRLFPTDSVHLAVCNFSLHWLSQVPSSVVDRESEAWNGGHVWIDGSRPKVCAAYASQFQADAQAFLRSRAAELVEGGVLFVLAGSRSEEHPAGCFTDPGDSNDLLMSDCAACWQDMVDEGEVSVEERDLFNIPYYNFHPRELETALKRLNEPGLELVTISLLSKCAVMPDKLFQALASNKEVYGATWSNMMATLVKPMVQAHLGNERAEKLFIRLQRKATERASRFIPSNIDTPTFHAVVATIQRRA